MSKYPVIIGRFEYVDIIGGLEQIPAKIDSGAFRSSIHATKIKLVKKNNKELLQFALLGHPTFPADKVMQVSNFNVRSIRSSNGHLSTRYEINLKIKLGYKVFITPFTLIDRSANVFPVLIGRKALNKRFLVDTYKSGMSRRALKLAASDTSIDEEDFEEVGL